MTWRVPLTATTLGEEEARAAAEVVRSGWLTQGEQVAAFEREFAAMVGTSHGVAVANCTLALELAYVALGVRAGDEVIMPALTFVATANAARRLGATPVFADVRSEDDLCVDPADVLARVTPRTRCIVAVHYAGYAAEVPALRAAGLPVLEDCAHAPGARLEELGCGALGAVGAFSFFGNKNLTTGEGGMLTTSDEGLARELRLLRSHGMTTTTWDRHRGHAWSYDVTRVATNARMDEVRAAVGRVQLGRLAEANAARARVAAWYRARLAELPEVGVPFARPRGRGAHHLMVVLLPPGTARERVMASLREAGVQTSVHYPPTHRFSVYGPGAAPLARTDAIASRILTLPLGPAMTEGTVELVVDALRRALAG